MHIRLMIIFLIVTALSNTAHAMKDSGISPEAGEQVYRSYCLNCHGSKGKGNGPVAESLTPPPADLTGATTQNKQDKELLQTIKNGKAGTSMPSWKNDLSEQHIQNVLAYIRTLGR